MKRSLFSRVTVLSLAIALLLATGVQAVPAAASAPTLPPGSSATSTWKQAVDPAGLEAVKAAVRGKKLNVAFSSRGALADVVAVKTSQILRDEFGMDLTYEGMDTLVMTPAVLAGEKNVGEVSFARLASMYQGGGKPMIFAGSDIQNDYVVLATVDIQTPADLRGKLWGNNQSAGIALGARNAFFAKHGLDFDNDVTSVRLASSTVALQAMQAGQVHATLVHPDQAGQLMETNPGKFHILEATHDVFQTINDVWFSTSDWVDTNPDTVQAFSVASIMAARWAYEDRAGWLAIAKEWVPSVSEKVAADTYDLFAGEIKLWNPNGGVTVENCQQAMRDAVATASLDAEVDCSAIMTNKFEARSLEILGWR